MSVLDQFRNFINETEPLVIPNPTTFSGNVAITGTLTVTGSLTPEGSITLSSGDNVTLTKGYLLVGASANTAGSGYALTASLTKAVGAYADDAGTLYGAGAVRTGVFRNLITISHSNETSIFGVQGQLKIKAPLDCTLTTGNRAGSWNYLEIGGTATKTVTLSGADKATAGAFAMVDWDGVGALTLSTSHVLAGFAALTNITKGAGTFTQTGKFAAFATLNNASASYTAFGAGIHFGPNSVVVPFSFTDESTVASVTNGAILADISATANAGYIKVLVGTTERYIPLYALKAS